MNPAHEKEAEEYADSVVDRAATTKEPLWMNAKRDYLAALQGPSVMKLVEALEKLKKECGYQSGDGWIETDGIASRALAEFRGEEQT